MFPTINHINDLLPYIQDKPEFKVNNKGDYIVIDYHVQKEDTFDSPQAMEARGIKFWPDGILASRVIGKFFNRQERPDLEEKYFSENYRMFEKADGSLVHFLPIGGKLRAMTKAGITEVSEQCEREVDFHPDFWGALEDILELGLTPVFEYVGPNNRIVIPYKKPELILIAVRDNVTGEYQPLDDYANVLHVRRAKEYKNVTLEDVKEWKDKEGVVLVWESGYRLKLKADDYVLRHRTKDQVSLEKNVLALVLDDSVDDLAGILDEDDFERVKRYNDAVWKNIGRVAHGLSDLVHYLLGRERKEVALALPNYCAEKPVQSVFWQVYSGKDARESIVSLIKKNLTTQTRVDSVRYLIGVKWEDF